MENKYAVVEVCSEGVNPQVYIFEKSEYECLQDWIENHPGTIDRLIETNFRLVED